MELARARATIKSSLGGWLHTVAVRRSLDLLRAETRRKRRETRFVEETTMNAEPSWGDIQKHIDEAVAALPDKLREPIIYRFLEGQTQSAIAQHLGVSDSTVQYRLNKGIEQIRRFLKRRGVVAPTALLVSLLGSNLVAEAAPATLTLALGKLALVTVTGAVGSGVGASATGIAALGGALMVKKVIVAMAVILAGGVGVWMVSQREHPIAPTPAAPQPLQLAAHRAAQDRGAASETTEGRSSPTETIVPARSGVVTGRVFDAKSGTGFFGVQVLAAPARGETPTFRTKTGDNGYYRIEALDRGTWRIMRNDADWLGQKQLPWGYMPPMRVVQVAAGEETRNVDFPLDAGLRVCGRVFTRDGTAVAGARIVSSSTPESSADAEGRFTLVVLAPTRDLTLRALARGYWAEGVGPLEVVDNDVTDVTIVMDPVASIGGIVVDSEGEPVSDVSVAVHNVNVDPDAVGWGSAWGSTTNKAGRFEIPALAEGVYTVVAYDPSFPLTGEEPMQEVTLRAGEQTKDIRLVCETPGGIGISGRVTNNHGEPVGGAEITACSREGRRIHTHTDEDGRYEIIRLTDSVYSVTATHERYRSVSRGNVQPGGDSVDFVMKDRSVVEGQVVDARTNVPLAEFSVAQTSDNVDRVMLVRPDVVPRYDPKGRFTFRPSADRVTVAAWANGYSPNFVTLEVLPAGEAVMDVIIRLEPSGFTPEVGR